MYVLGNGTSAPNFVAPGSSGNVLTSNGSTWTSAAAAAFDSGTLMLFQQTAAPTGWTKSTTHNNKALRVVSGTASSGGSVDFTTAFASQTPTGSVIITSVTGTAGATTLSTPQIPAHNHIFTGRDERQPEKHFTSKFLVLLQAILALFHFAIQVVAVLTTTHLALLLVLVHSVVVQLILLYNM
jgi:hypothetical protein